MRHIRPLPPIEHETRTHYHPDETAVFAPDWNGLRALRDRVQEQYRVALEEAPLHAVLCDGAASPSGLFSVVYRVSRPEDLLDEYAESSSPAPDLDIGALRSEARSWRERLEAGNLASGESEAEARWRIQRYKKRAEDLFRRLNEKEIEVREQWEGPYPAVLPEKQPA